MAAMFSFNDLHTYYKVDRDIFTRLVTVFMRDPAESMLVIALWLWLEHEGYPNIISKMINWPRFFLEIMFGETVSALKFLEINQPPATHDEGGMNFTSRVMQKGISLQFFHEKRLDAIDGIKKVLNSISVDQLIKVRGFPHELFGDVQIVWKGFSDNAISIEELQWGFPGPETDIISEENDRTQFLTFSRGNPVTETAVREIFSQLYGRNSVADVHIQRNVSGNAHPLCARLVFSSATAVDGIINGRSITKFHFRDRYFWARKYERSKHI
ncbi:hypothetical protein Ddye_007298 [Dipteronia dyeriana]|uniref:RRM domain-containing protein n=1 Tax=Dipteronia dyeriana TaxID=168575 RepID=A0AAD9XJQ3_9ROSI|nr:hypothetical protein Ddye_007298 [Dipteronia dyeriana]